MKNKYSSLDDPEESEANITINCQQPITKKDIIKDIIKVSHLGLAFALLYVALYVYLNFNILMYFNFNSSNVAQSNLTTLFPDFGLFTFCIIYLCFALGGIIGPEVGNALGSKWSMVLGASTIAIFVGSINLKQVI
ncbi:hypothetical protein HK096_006347 [Nowakowskiella sp. JEL0078]|nr:hypothetical protein HK096_006347 [Nowakowskiella sp. JEL0078]